MQHRQQLQMILPSEGSFVASKRAMLKLFCNSAATEAPLYKLMQPLQQSM
jgi:hypothetical protein